MGVVPVVEMIMMHQKCEGAKKMRHSETFFLRQLVSVPLCKKDALNCQGS